MHKARWAFLAAVGILAGTLAVDAVAQVIIGGKPRLPATFREGVAIGANLKEKTIEKVFKVMGPAAAEQLANGRIVELPGLGALRVVRVAEGKDLDRSGRPITVPARNYIEFVSSADLEAVANAPGAVPARTVEPFEFKVNPAHNPGIKSESLKTSRTRPR